MRIYLDTSSLIKLYHTEPGTKELDELFEASKIKEVIVSSLSKVEFSSALWKKVRTNELTENEALAIITSFEADYSNFSFIDVSNEVILSAKNLLSKYGGRGLRALDSIQLASIIKVSSGLDVAVTADNLLKTLIGMEGINNDLPEG